MLWLKAKIEYDHQPATMLHLQIYYTMN